MSSMEDKVSSEPSFSQEDRVRVAIPSAARIESIVKSAHQYYTDYQPGRGYGLNADHSRLPSRWMVEVAENYFDFNALLIDYGRRQPALRMMALSPLDRQWVNGSNPQYFSAIETDFWTALRANENRYRYEKAHREHDRTKNWASGKRVSIPAADFVIPTGGLAVIPHLMKSGARYEIRFTLHSRRSRETRGAGTFLVQSLLVTPPNYRAIMQYISQSPGNVEHISSLLAPALRSENKLPLEPNLLFVFGYRKAG